MKVSIRILSALLAQAKLQRLDQDALFQIYDTERATSALIGETVIAAVQKPYRSKDISLQHQEQERLQKAREEGDERPINQ